MLTAYAEKATGAAAGAAAGAGGGAFTLIYLAAMIAIFYFLLIRPQKKRQRQMANMIDALMVGDELVTAGGIIGKVSSIKEDSVTIETGADKTKIKIEKNSISRVITVHE